MERDGDATRRTVQTTGEVPLGGASSRGPVIDRFQTEAAARQSSPGAVGEWPGHEATGSEDQRSFGYQRVADAIHGVA